MLTAAPGRLWPRLAGTSDTTAHPNHTRRAAAAERAEPMASARAKPSVTAPVARAAVGPGLMAMGVLRLSVPGGGPVSSWRSAWVKAVRAAFGITIGPENGGVHRTPIEPIITIRPRARRSSGRKAWVTASCPTVLT